MCERCGAPVTFAGTFEDVDDYIESLCGWGLEFSQLEPGVTRSSNLTINTEDYSFLRFSHSVVSRQLALAQGQGINFFLPEASAKILMVDNQPCSFDVLCSRPEGDDFDLLTPGDFEAYAFRFSIPTLLDLGYQWLVDALAQKRFNFSLLASDAESIRHSLRAVARLLEASDLPLQEVNVRVCDIYQNILIPSVAKAVVSRLGGAHCCGVAAGQAHMSRILTYISGNLESPPSVEALADLVGVSSRYVQQLFKRNLGLSPKQYMRSLRLNGVRRNLLRHQSRRGLVTAVASSHGFDHLGQFASDYKTLFGELPNETLAGNGKDAE